MEKTNKVSYVTRLKQVAVMLAIGLIGASAVHAGTDATAIVSAASTAFGDIAALCVSIGTFFVVYRLVKRVG